LWRGPEPLTNLKAFKAAFLGVQCDLAGRSVTGTEGLLPGATRRQTPGKQGGVY
jgi:hypothetical protein